MRINNDLPDKGFQRILLGIDTRSCLGKRLDILHRFDKDLLERNNLQNTDE